MNWQQLFEIQAGLDQHIIEEKKLQGQDLLDKKILALQVELGELANEWRGFKFWSNYPKPQNPYNKGCDNCVGGISKLSPLLGPYKKCEYCVVNPLLEEYVDCLHFILSIGLDIGFDDYEFLNNKTDAPIDIHEMFSVVFSEISDVYAVIDSNQYYFNYTSLVFTFNQLGAMLGFTEEQIEAAYLEKNRVNHERQNTGY